MIDENMDKCDVAVCDEIGGMDNLLDFFVEQLSHDFSSSSRLMNTHLKGAFLHGKSGTGKSLFLKALARRLQAKDPKVVVKPQLLLNWIDSPKLAAKKIFDDAVKDYVKHGDQRPLHLIIFDDIDFFTTKMVVLRELLNKIDDILSLDNVFIIGTTNRADLVTNELLRPCRLEFSTAIGFLSQSACKDVLKIHTKGLEKCGFFHSDVNLEEIAAIAFGLRMNGAELFGVVQSALCSAAMRAPISAKRCADEKQISVKQEDFVHGIKVISKQR